MNPVAGSPVTKPNASANVVAAAEAISARARESQYVAGSSPTKSPEKYLVKGPHHKQLQSLNNGTVKDLSFYLENGRSSNRSPERSPDRSRGSTITDRFESKSPTRPESRSETPTPLSRDIGKDMPSLRPAGRPPLKAILGEESPQSATMRALQGKSNENNDSKSADSRRDSLALIRTPQSIDAISSQILSLTTIATNLQQEMAQLSRRSRDNATDLVSLKDATNLRDEDIRQTLRELVVNLQAKKETIEPAKRPYPRTNGSIFIEEKPHFSPSTPKSISLPRIPSPASFAASLDRELISSPNPYSTDGVAAIALLEKILREMGTKDGQEQIMQIIEESTSRQPITTASPAILKRLEDIVSMLKDGSQIKAVVRMGGPQVQLNTDTPDPAYDYSRHPAIALARASRNVSMGNIPSVSTAGDVKASIPSGVVNEDMAKLIKRIKDSVTESGGLTNEVKALVRELRGEVLGMGREIGRKLDVVEKNSGKQSENVTSQDQMIEIVEAGLTQLKKHMDDVLRDHRRQSAASMVSKNAVDAQEVYATVQSALRDLQPDLTQQKTPEFGREDILDAVREAWETYKPEIEVKNFGLERDEILECLESGLKDYQSQISTDSNKLAYADVLDAVKQGLQDFKPPHLDTESSLTRDEIITTMRECMESMNMSSQPKSSDYQQQEIVDALKEVLLLHGAELSHNSTVSREDLLDAVRDGFINHEPLSKDMEINRDDLLDAVKSGLQDLPVNQLNDNILDKMREMIKGTRDDFQQHSSANDKDTEQVLDAMKDRMETLRANIETYVDRASDITGKDEIIETVKDCVENLRADLEASITNSRGPAPTQSSELLDVMEKEFEHLRASLTTSLARSEVQSGSREDILDAVREALQDLKGSNLSAKDHSTIEGEIRHLRETLASTMTRSQGIDREEILETIRDGVDRMKLNDKTDQSESVVSSTSELLDAFHEGLDKLKSDIEQVVGKDHIEGIRCDIERVANEINRPIDMTINYEILDLLKEGLATVKLDMAKLITQQEVVSNRGKEVVVADGEANKVPSNPAIDNLEVMITQLKIKVDALDHQTAPVDHMTLRPDFENLENMVKDLQGSVQDIKAGDKGNAVTKDDIEAIETILLNSKAKLDEISMPNSNDFAKGTQVESLEILLKDLSTAIDDLRLRQEDNLPSKEAFDNLEATVNTIRDGMDLLRESIGEDLIRRADIETVEAICLETKTQLSDLVPDGAKVATDNAVTDLQILMKDAHEQTQIFHDKMLLEAEMTAQAFDARKIEHGGLADKIEDVKAFLENIRIELQSKFESSGQGIESLALSLTTLGESLTAANAVESLKVMKEFLETKLSQMDDNHLASLDSHRQMFTEKQDEHKAFIMDELATRLDLSFGELMTKYNNLHTSNIEKINSMDEKTRDGIDAMLSTKVIADDLKALVDTLGHTVTESCNNMSEDSKTVFIKVEELGVKQDVGFSSLASELKEDNHLTRTTLARTSSTLENVYSLISEHNPKVMEAIHDVLNVMSQHFEMAQKSTEEIKSSVKELPAIMPFPALPAPVSSPIEEHAYFPSKYDDSEVHSKLDRLAALAAEAGQSATQLELLEQINTKVAATAAEFDTFIKSQLALAADKEDYRHRELEEAGIALEKRTFQKQTVEADIVNLTVEKEQLSTDVTQLKESIGVLQQEEKQMMSYRAKLQAELSSIETALEIRKEEMHIMESRAEKLERRIIDGVLDQSRSALLGSRPLSGLNVMNLKRIPSATSHMTATKGINTATSTRTGTSTKPTNASTSSTLSNTLGKALKRRQAGPISASPAGSTRGDRRILSLSTISGNKGAAKETLALIDPGSKIAKESTTTVGLSALKRSHSVKSSLPSRNTSWGASKPRNLSTQPPDMDKENNVLAEADESSDAGTETPSNYTKTCNGTDLGTDSYIVETSTGSRRPSYTPSSVIGTMDESDQDQEEEEEVYATRGDQLQVYTGTQEYDLVNKDKNMVLFGKDSGIGSEPATSTLGTDGNFFDGE